MTPPMAPARRTDFHSHLVPGVDDGAHEPADSARALGRFRAEGVGQLITTPHFMGSLTLNQARLEERLAELDAGWERLARVVREDAAHHGTALRVERGVEVMLDVPEPDLSDARLRLAGGSFVLVEYHNLQLPPNAEFAVAALRRQGWRPVIAHPERYRNLHPSLAQVARLREAGALLQVNAGSLFGDYGRTAAGHARAVLAAGWADYVSSDYHCRGEPGVARCAHSLIEAGFVEQAQLLSVTNPGRLLNGDDPLPVPPLQTREARPWWARLFGRR
jgi:tyrosine-protein phosphatase YwqE